MVWIIVLMDEFNLDESLGYIVAKTNWYLKTYFSKLIKEHSLNVTPEQWAVLNAIHNKPGISQTEIAKDILKDKTNVTRILDVLQKNGYITRRQAENDRRAFVINLTEGGEMVLKQLREIASTANEVYMSSLGNDELDNLFSALNKICISLERKI